jgi:hypothetical protein
MVGTEVGEVERELCDGRLRCPSCQGAMRPWGHGRVRVLRDRADSLRLRPRRSRCLGCARTHVLLPETLLARRADTVAVIGAGLAARVGGAGHRRIAAGLRRPVSTVRGWLRRFAARAESIRVAFTTLADALDPALPPAPPTGSGFADAVAPIGVAARAAALRLGPWPPWPFAARAGPGLGFPDRLIGGFHAAVCRFKYSL